MDPNFRNEIQTNCTRKQLDNVKSAYSTTRLLQPYSRVGNHANYRHKLALPWIHVDN